MVVRMSTRVDDVISGRLIGQSPPSLDGIFPSQSEISLKRTWINKSYLRGDFYDYKQLKNIK